MVLGAWVGTILRVGFCALLACVYALDCEDFDAITTLMRSEKDSNG